MDEEQAKQVRWRATIDQASGTVADLAPLIAAYYKSLVEWGFPEQFALLLTRDFQATVMGVMGVQAKQV